MTRSPKRRRFLQYSALASVAAAAGCLGETGGTVPETADRTPAGNGAAASTPPDDLDAWLTDANGYDGETRRYGPQARPTVWVGEPLDDGLAFAPPVIEVPPETMVRWDWTGHGGQHNVVALDGTFDSGRTNAQAGTEYHYLFEEPGVHPYVSEPDEEGMRGAVIVKEPPTTGNDAVDEWLAASSNFDGEVVERTGAETTTITVGAAGNGGHFAFDPPVVEVSAGTTVEWRWSEESAPHNVAFEGRDLRSGSVRTEPGVHFSHAFEREGTFLYACEPHESLGMRGAVIVS
jgi:halocyanin-like protein